MWLKRIELKNFKRFVDFPAQFSPGINVVKGPRNEMGKSTLLEGIVAALFYDVKSVKKEVKDCVSWGSDRQYETLVEFEEKGKTYSLYKDFEKGVVSFIGHNTGEKFDTSKKISGKMKDLLGTDSNEFFSSTSCIYQDQVKEISSGKKQISDSLEEVVTGGKEGILASQAMKKLDSKIAETRKGLDKLAKNPGILASLKNKLQDISQRYNEVRGEVSEVEAQKIELVEVNKQMAQVKEQYENSKALLEKNKNLRDIEVSIKGLEQKYDEVEELLGGINELMTKLGRADEALRSIEGLENELQVSEFRKGLDAIQNTRGNIERDLARREEKVTETKDKLDRRKPLRFLGSGRGLATSIIILAGGIIGALIVSSYFWGLAILGAALLVITIRASRALVRYKTNISGIEERIQEMKEALGKLGKEEKELLAEAKCSTVGEFDKKEMDFKNSLKDKGNLEAQLKGMLRGGSVEDFQKQKREIARDLEGKRAKLTDDLTATRLSPEEYIELERKVQSLKAKQDELEDRKRDSLAVIKMAKFDAENQIKLEEELESLQEALKHEERKVKVYELAREFISQARTEILSSAEEALEKEIQIYLAVFTNGKYKQVKINKEGLEFWIYSDEKGGLAKPEELSGGVIDEFYLACRLALVKLIFGDKKPPLILDDPFVNFDSIRLANTLNFFKTLASDYQIIIFTLSDLYDKVADNIILLGEKEKHTST
jgi:DNA repair exonuclease SbcCD ATPase subunit